jgi:hypothetical protein
VSAACPECEERSESRDPEHAGAFKRFSSTLSLKNTPEQIANYARPGHYCIVT